MTITVVIIISNCSIGIISWGSNHITDYATVFRDCSIFNIDYDCLKNRCWVRLAGLGHLTFYEEIMGSNPIPNTKYYKIATIMKMMLFIAMIILFDAILAIMHALRGNIGLSLWFTFLTGLMGLCAYTFSTEDINTTKYFLSSAFTSIIKWLKK